MSIRSYLAGGGVNPTIWARDEPGGTNFSLEWTGPGTSGFEHIYMRSQFVGAACGRAVDAYVGLLCLKIAGVWSTVINDGNYVFRQCYMPTDSLVYLVGRYWSGGAWRNGIFKYVISTATLTVDKDLGLWQAPPPNVYAVRSIHGTGPNDIWVGCHGSWWALANDMWHWDGGAWTSAQVGWYTSFNHIHAVNAGLVYASGANPVDDKVFRYNGAWAEIQSWTGGSTEHGGWGVFATAADNVFVGVFRDSTGVSYIYRYTGVWGLVATWPFGGGNNGKVLKFSPDGSIGLGMPPVLWNRSVDGGATWSGLTVNVPGIADIRGGHFVTIGTLYERDLVDSSLSITDVVEM
jgi:hypothetical protein